MQSTQNMMRRLVLWWLKRQGVLVEWLPGDLHAAADIIESVDDYGRIPQTVRSLAEALARGTTTQEA